uniref:VWFD domain-containing protein n=1 Tax=Athene cunicularia TaxID=194338 RepID=A0A663N0Z7_ATHCN
CSANSHYEPCAAACPATCVDPIAPYTCNLPCVEGCVCDSGYLLYNDRCVPSQQCGCWHNGQHYPVGSEFWTDNTCSSKCMCPARGSKVQCFSASCPAGQYCGVQDGKPQCLEQSYGICHVHSDPHYNTFDKVTHSFMGNCTYTLAKVCSNTTSLPYFNVEAKNEHRGNSRVSYVREVLIEVYGERIVNNVRQTLPVSAAGGAITVSRSGRYIVLETDFNLRVSYDTDHSVEVKVPTTYFNLTCGMCGNFNNRREDDYMMPDGQQAADSNALGESWQVPDDDSSCGVPVPSPPCSAEDEKLYRSDQFCGMLTARPGSFERCHGVINPQSYFETCFYDLCALSGGQEFLCAALEAYADACQAAGVTLLPWRNATFCPVACPPNSYYNPCTSACPATCLDPLASKNCSRPCVEGCECNNGFVISGGQCVSLSNCGCLQNGKYYEKGESFWQTDCAGQCICAENGTVVCNSDTCEVGEVCKVQNGFLGCYPLNPSTCHIFGDPHYITFDGRLYHFQGNCNYTVVDICTNSSERFSVTTRNEHRGNPNWTALNSVAVTLKNLHIVLEKNRETYVSVNGVQVYHPVDLNHGARVAMKGHYVVIDTSLGFQVKFDGDQELFILVDESLKGQLCGLCGTFNDNQLDDFLKPDKVLEQDPNKFGDSWLPFFDITCWCNPVTVVSPTCDTAKEKEYEELCKIILKNSGPFQVCHWHIPPQPYFESCVYDLCATEGNSDQFCKILEAYAAACDLAGVNLGEWRKDTICALLCPANSYYDPCMTGCPATCVDQQAPQNCSKPCTEGCACTSGFLLSGDTCVPEAHCGCLFEGNYYSVSENPALNCTRQCRCAANGQMVCSALSCGEDEVCKIQNGQRGCYPAGTALCHIYGDPHYRTFDGKLHHFQGSCNYTVVTGCDNSSVGFSVTTRNEHRGSQSWTALNSVALSVEGHLFMLLSPSLTLMQINGALASLPASPAPGVTISLSGSYVRVSTKLGLQLQFNGDHELLVKVSEKHKGELCGLCGTYTGSQLDDFTRPDGVVVPNVNDFGASCGDCVAHPSIGPPVSCSPSEQEAANMQCAILTQLGGPFQPCHAALPPKTYFESCVYDQCATGGSTEQFCNDLGAYAAACAEAGVALGDWSAGTVCGKCSVDLLWGPDSRKGAAVVQASLAGEGCGSRRTCVCSALLLLALKCSRGVGGAPRAMLGLCRPAFSRCDMRWKQGNCRSMVEIQRELFYLSLLPGRASCSASGDPHYNTFDNRVHHFMGNCTYTLSKMCSVTKRLPYFDVSTTNEHRGANTKVSYVKSVQPYTNFYNLLVQVNGSRMNLPVFIEKKISIQSSGGYVLLETDFGLWVRYDGNHYAEVSVPSSYRGLLCGLCGNYNGDPNDDNIKPNGDIASGSTDFGQSWLVPENNTICSSGTEEQCDPVLESEAKKNTACGMITDPTGSMLDCHTQVPPENFFENCVYDMCFTDGQATSLCYGLQAYAESCINAGICIEWRNATLCRECWVPLVPILCSTGQFSACQISSKGPFAADGVMHFTCKGEVAISLLI